MSAVNGVPKPQKEMSKAERRELQEKQRAAKAAAKAGGQPAPSASKPPQQKESKPSPSAAPRAPKPAHSDATSSKSGAPRAAPAVSVSEDQDRLRGPRLFSHFGLPKHAGSFAKTVGHEIHPAILQLALRFAEFKITGANARCLATLYALKTVSHEHASAHDCPMLTRFQGNTRLPNTFRFDNES